MAEEQEQQSGGSSIKNVIIGFISTITLGVGGWVTTKLTGGDDKEATPTQQAAPVINITNSNQQAAGKTVIVNGGGGGSKSTTPAPKPKPKKEGDEFKEEAPKW